MIFVEKCLPLHDICYNLIFKKCIPLINSPRTLIRIKNLTLGICEADPHLLTDDGTFLFVAVTWEPNEFLLG